MSEELPQLELSSAGDGIWIQFRGYAYPEAADTWGHDLLSASLTVKAQPFAGTFATTIWRSELGQLRQHLDQLWRSFSPGASSSFRFMEVQLTLSFEIEGNGQIALAVSFSTAPWSNTLLSFSLALEHMQLQRWIDQIDAILALYPNES